MLFAWLGKDYTVDQLSRLTSLLKIDNGVTNANLSYLMNLLGAKTVVKQYNLETIKADLDAGKPVICLITYGYIPGRQSSYSGGHFVIAVGYDENYIYINDPDWYGVRRNEGKKFAVPLQSFANAVSRSPQPSYCIGFTDVVFYGASSAVSLALDGRISQTESDRLLAETPH